LLLHMPPDIFEIEQPYVIALGHRFLTTQVRRSR